MLNKVVLMGRICMDLELKTTQSGLSYTRFNIAVDRNYTKKKQTDFITITAWRNTAEFITKYFSKGQMIAVDGSIRTNTYQDKDGNKRKVYEILADSVFFCGSKKESSQESTSANENKTEDTQNNGLPSDFQEIEEDDDLPF